MRAGVLVQHHEGPRGRHRPHWAGTAPCQAASSTRRVHLIGHSFGARLVSFALAGIDSPQRSPVASLLLVQGAFSHWSFAHAQDNPFGRPGALNAVRSGPRTAGRYVQRVRLGGRRVVPEGVLPFPTGHAVERRALGRHGRRRLPGGASAGGYRTMPPAAALWIQTPHVLPGQCGEVINDVEPASSPARTPTSASPLSPSWQPRQQGREPWPEHLCCAEAAGRGEETADDPHGSRQTRGRMALSEWSVPIRRRLGSASGNSVKSLRELRQRIHRER